MSKIRAKNGEIIDLIAARARHEASMREMPADMLGADSPAHSMTALFDALESMLRIPRKRASNGEEEFAIAYNVAVADYRRVAGFIEEGEV